MQLRSPRRSTSEASTRYPGKQTWSATASASPIADRVRSAHGIERQVSPQRCWQRTQWSDSLHRLADATGQYRRMTDADSQWKCAFRKRHIAWRRRENCCAASSSDLFSVASDRFQSYRVCRASIARLGVLTPSRRFAAVRRDGRYWGTASPIANCHADGRYRGVRELTERS